jgi:hypothetical protein
MDEKLLFSNADIKVSNQHLNVRGKVYAIADINQVELTFVEPKRILATILFLLGLFLLLDEGNLFALGGFSIILSVVFWISGGTKYAVVIHSAAGEKQVFVSDDRLLTEKIIYALDNAMLEHANPRMASTYATNENDYRDNNDISFGAS